MAFSGSISPAHPLTVLTWCTPAFICDPMSLPLLTPETPTGSHSLRRLRIYSCPRLPNALSTIPLVCLPFLPLLEFFNHVLEGAWAVRPRIKERRETCRLCVCACFSASCVPLLSSSIPSCASPSCPSLNSSTLNLRRISFCPQSLSCEPTCPPTSLPSSIRTPGRPSPRHRPSMQAKGPGSPSCTGWVMATHLLVNECGTQPSRFWSYCLPEWQPPCFHNCPHR